MCLAFSAISSADMGTLAFALVSPFFLILHCGIALPLDGDIGLFTFAVAPSPPPPPLASGDTGGVPIAARRAPSCADFMVAMSWLTTRPAVKSDSRRMALRPACSACCSEIRRSFSDFFRILDATFLAREAELMFSWALLPNIWPKHSSSCGSFLQHCSNSSSDTGAHTYTHVVSYIAASQWQRTHQHHPRWRQACVAAGMPQLMSDSRSLGC